MMSHILHPTRLIYPHQEMKALDCSSLACVQNLGKHNPQNLIPCLLNVQVTVSPQTKSFCSDMVGMCCGMTIIQHMCSLIPVFSPLRLVIINHSIWNYCQVIANEICIFSPPIVHLLCMDGQTSVFVVSWLGQSGNAHSIFTHCHCQQSLVP